MVTVNGLERRTSGRIQEKQRLEKERLVRRRVELLEREDNFKRARREDTDLVLEAASKALDVNEDTKIKKKPSPKAKSNGDGSNASSQIETNVTGDGESSGKSAQMQVKETLRVFNKYYLHFVQEEEIRCFKAESEKSPKSKNKKSKKSATPPRGLDKNKSNRQNLQKSASSPKDADKKKSKRPDLKVITKMIETKSMLYRDTQIGQLPGIDAGHHFYSRAEMVVVGLHGHWLNGIHYIGQNCKKTAQLKEYKNCQLPLAVSIVMSGMYEDDVDKADEIVYTGQGGHDLNGNKRQVEDQVLLRGNLALKNCIEAGVPVRVTRGHDSKISYTKRLYTYDGLYNVTQYWVEPGLAGFTVYKFRLKRCEGQPKLTTSQVNFVNKGGQQSISELRGLVCDDITGGQERIPIPATNVVDEPPLAPIGYKYRKDNEVAKNVKIPSAAAGCDCRGECINSRTCACAKLNGSEFPYVKLNGGRLIEAKDVVFECGPNCGCGPGCVNRTTQKGMPYRLEVFRTASKGWGVRSWDFIPSGAPVCEYTGKLVRSEDLDNASSENNYIFEIDCLQTMKGIGGRERRSLGVSVPTIPNLDVPDEQKSENVPEFSIDAGVVGNIARFINHSCEPNLFVQCVLSSHHDAKLAKVMLFAADNIPPLQELTYDYGYALDSVHGPDGKVLQVPCYCGAVGCRKRLL